MSRIHTNVEKDEAAETNHNGEKSNLPRDQSLRRDGRRDAHHCVPHTENLGFGRGGVDITLVDVVGEDRRHSDKLCRRGRRDSEVLYKLSYVIEEQVRRKLTRSTSRIPAPDMFSNAPAAAEAGRPAETSAGESVGMSGSPLKATAASPRVVANVNGIANLYS
jgi:hypothetical protein